MQRYQFPAQNQGRQWEQCKADVQEIFLGSPGKDRVGEETPKCSEVGIPDEIKMAIPDGCLLMTEDQGTAFRIAKVEQVYGDAGRDE